MAQYREILEAAEREADFEDVAKGLTLDLADFERQAWAIVEPDTPLQWNWHYDYLCEWLTLVANGKFREQYPEKLGLIINVPPRSGKSTFATVNFPTWVWVKLPSRRFLFGSHTGSLARFHNGKRNFLMQSKWFQERFGNRFRLTTTGESLTQNDHTGRYQLASITGSQTGFGGLIAIGDDLLDRQNAFSSTIKLRTNKWIDSSFSKMLDDAVRGVFIHISQRLAVDDPTGHLLGEDEDPGSPDAKRKKEQWVQIKIRREATEPEEYVFPISGRRVTRNKGDILQADRCPPRVIVNLKANSRSWANQEQQEPTPDTGAILQRNWIKFYRAGESLPSFFQVIESIDCTFKDGDGTDMVAIHKYGLAAKRRILLDRHTERLNYPSTKQAAKEQARGGHRVSWLRDPMPAATQLLIENKANGPALTAELRADPEFNLGIIEYDPGRSSKTERFITASADAEAGLIYLPEDAPWIGELLKYLCEYAGEGSVAFDDDCDAFSQFVNWSRQMQYGYLAFLDKQAEAAAADQVIHRCEYEVSPGVLIVLEWDPAKEVWVGPNGEEYSAGSNNEGDSSVSGDGAASAEAAAAETDPAA